MRMHFGRGGNKIQNKIKYLDCWRNVHCFQTLVEGAYSLLTIKWDLGRGLGLNSHR